MDFNGFYNNQFINPTKYLECATPQRQEIKAFKWASDIWNNSIEGEITQKGEMVLDQMVVSNNNFSGHIL